jgi:hypothetical protein
MMTDVAERTQRIGRWASLAGAVALAACSSKIGDPMGQPGQGGSGPSAGTGGSGGAGGAGGPSGAGVGGASGGTAGGGGSTDTCTPLASVPRRVWRLSAEQYGNAVQGLLGLAQPPSLDATGGVSPYAFFTDETAMIDAPMQYSIYQATQGFMPQIAAKIPQLAACNTGEVGTATGEQACAQRFAQTFGQKAFRRPLDASETTALLAVYTQGRLQDFNTGISTMIEALVQSPSFLHRFEIGTGTVTPDSSGHIPDATLTPYEVASQLSFLFMNSSPDQPLMDAAASGSLSTADGVASQVDRLLGLDAVKQNITRIVGAWFNVSQLFSKTKDPAFFSGLPAADQDPTQLEDDVFSATLQFIDDVLWHGTGHVNDLLTSPRVFVNQRLATLYGLPFTGAAGQFAAVTDTHRAGMLTQPGFLWALSDPTTTSIVKRGKFIHDDVICQNPGPPPIGILDDPAVQEALAELPTEIEKSNYRMGQAVPVPDDILQQKRAAGVALQCTQMGSQCVLQTQRCAGCHSQIDPYSRTLENFDPIGAYRTSADGVPVDPSATLPPPLTATVSGATAYANAIVAADQLHSCAVQKITSYVLGRMIRDSATCEIRDLRTQFEQTEPTISNLFRKVALAGFVRARSGGAQ